MKIILVKNIQWIYQKILGTVTVLKNIEEEKCEVLNFTNAIF
eukprot:UN00932